MQNTSALPDPADRPTMRVEEVAQALDLSRGSAYAAVKAGDLPSIRIGKRILVPTAELRRMLGIGTS